MILTGDQIRSLITEVADELDPSGATTHTIIIVGGSLLAWHELRDSTHDVDSVRRIEAELQEAVAVVADRHDLAPQWLNDRALPFAPEGLAPEVCDVLLETRRLKVLGAPLRDTFLMKLSRAQPQDLIDMRVLWPHVADMFETAQNIIESFATASRTNQTTPT